MKVGKPRGITLNGPALREIRMAKGLTVRAAAAAAGISAPVWSQYEGGTRAASQDAFDGVCQALGIKDERSIRADTLAEVQADLDRNRERRNNALARIA